MREKKSPAKKRPPKNFEKELLRLTLADAKHRRHADLDIQAKKQRDEALEDGIRFHKKVLGSTVGEMERSRYPFHEESPANKSLREYAQGTGPEREEEITITMNREQAERFRDRFADFLCWWRGFRTGFKVKEEYSVDLDFPENGYRAISDMHDKVRRQIEYMDNKDKHPFA